LIAYRNRRRKQRLGFRRSNGGRLRKRGRAKSEEAKRKKAEEDEAVSVKCK
jgi:hypothetical protein